MAERKPISKKTRFEVFKRDRFTCQYCGRMSPDVILEVDHIKPIAEGGTNKMINLITSCRDCNRGKGKRKLSDDAELKKQQKELVDLADKREQAEMMIKWRDSMIDITTEQGKSIGRLIQSFTGLELNQYGMSRVMALLRRFGYNEVWEATEISFTHYYNGEPESFSEACRKIGGICHNRKKQKEEEQNGDTQEHTDVVLDGHEDM